MNRQPAANIKYERTMAFWPQHRQDAIILLGIAGKVYIGQDRQYHK